MKHISQKFLALSIALCLMLSIGMIPSYAVDSDQELPMDYQFEEVTEEEIVQNTDKISFDPFSSLQWDMKLIGMDKAWESGLTGKGVKVGVIDSGISATTMDIPRSRLVKGKNLTDASGLFSSPLVDMEGHGTFISGIIGASKGNGVSIAGVAPESTLVSVKTLSREAEAIYACVDEYDCDVINMSLGGPYDTKELRDAIQYANSKGVILVAAVGNDGNGNVEYPAAYPEVIGVGSVDKNSNVSSFSNRNDSVYVAAPGEKVLSLGPTPFLVYRSSGTSFSAPFVSGLAALLKQAHPEMTNEDFKEILKTSSKDLGATGYDTDSGWGLIQAPAAISAANKKFSGSGNAETDAQDRPLDEQFEDITEKDVDQNAEKLSFDPFSPLQWDMKMIGMQKGWRSGLTGNGVRVGIIDTGVSTRTGDIASDRLLAGKNFAEENGSTNDTDGHGTFVAGIIGAEKGNGKGIAGVAPGVTIVPLKTSTDGKSTTKRNAEAIYAAVDEFHCDVINISSGSLNGSETLHNAVKYAESKGVIIVCSTGNEGSEAFHYPGAYEETIGVGFVNILKKASSFSHKNTSICVTAPGEAVVSLSTIPLIARLGSGSSYAAPFVTGLAALLKEKYPNMTKNDFEEILKASSQDLGDKGYDTTFGWGLVQVPDAIACANQYFNRGAAETEVTADSISVISRLRDVVKGSWFYKPIQYVTEHKYMLGVREDQFAPMSRVTRAQLAQILYSMEGKPDFESDGMFSDTLSKSWYFKPIMWAESEGLVKGFPDGSFRPDATATREQVAVILRRYAEYKGTHGNAFKDSVNKRFADFEKVSNYAKDAIKWAVSNSILAGDKSGNLTPRGAATRGEIAAMLMRFDQIK